MLFRRILGSGDFDDRPPFDMLEDALEGEAETVRLLLLSGAGDIEPRNDPPRNEPVLAVENLRALSFALASFFACNPQSGSTE